MKLRNKKTGEIFDLDKMPKWLKESIQICATFYSRECEVYEPAEPLIKDEKIRKAVRAWAEANSLDKIQYRKEDLGARFNGADFEYIQFNPWDADNLEDYKEYTIAELCGEEE